MTDSEQLHRPVEDSYGWRGYRILILRDLSAMAAASGNYVRLRVLRQCAVTLTGTLFRSAFATGHSAPAAATAS